MATLETLKQRYPNAQYEPAMYCHKCNGTGEFPFKGGFVKSMKPCFCIFFGSNFAHLFQANNRASFISIIKEEDKYLRENGWIQIDGGAWISGDLDLCSRCFHANHYHITRDLNTYKCLEPNCNC
jgi:hypothetical protein